MKKYILTMVLLLGVAISFAQAPVQEIKLTTNFFEAGVVTSEGFEAKISKLLSMDFTMTRKYIKVNDKAQSNYLLGAKIRGESNDPYFKSTYDAVDEKGRECVVRIEFQPDYRQIWIVYGPDDVYKYTLFKKKKQDG